MKSMIFTLCLSLLPLVAKAEYLELADIPDDGDRLTLYCHGLNCLMDRGDKRLFVVKRNPESQPYGVMVFNYVKDENGKKKFKSFTQDATVDATVEEGHSLRIQNADRMEVLVIISESTTFSVIRL